MTQNKQAEINLKYAPRYNLQGVSANEVDSIQALLDEGYEPFAVTEILVPVPVQQEKILTAEKAKNPFQMIPQTKIWFRQLVHVPVSETIERENGSTLKAVESK